MKKLIVTAFVIFSFSTATQACSLCRWVEEKLVATWEWLEYNRCYSQRARYSQLTGRPFPPCDHNGKHDNPSK